MPEDMRMSLTDYCRQMRSAEDETTEFGDERVVSGEAVLEGSGADSDADVKLDERTEDSQ